MTEHLTKDLEFNMAADTREDIELYGSVTADFLNDRVLCIEDEHAGQHITLNVPEARALRDYLSKVLP